MPIRVFADVALRGKAPVHRKPDPRALAYAFLFPTLVGACVHLLRSAVDRPIGALLVGYALRND